MRNSLAETSIPRRQVPVLVALIVGGLAVRIAFLQGRWINADEGAHLMDGLLVLEGFVPDVDYGARQVLYTYMLAFLLKVFGVSYAAARIYPVVATVGVGVLVYLIAARLLDRGTALVAAAIYLFLPFTIVYGTHVKTEPLTILLSSLGVYALLVGLDRKANFVPFMLAGITFGLAFYVRQSALTLLGASFVALFLAIRQLRPALRATSGVLAGFVLVCAAVMAVFATMLPARRVLLGTNLNPAAFVVASVYPIVAAVMPESRAPEEESAPDGPGAGQDVGGGDSAIERADQPVANTVRNLRRTAILNSVLLAALFVSPLFLLGRARAVGGVREHYALAAIVLYSWLGAVALGYALYAVIRSFYPAYFGEFIPPLAILAAAVAVGSLERLRPSRKSRLRDLVVFGVLAAGFIALHTILGPASLHRPLYYVAVPIVLALAYLGGPVGARHVAAIAVIALAFYATIHLAGQAGGTRLLLYATLLMVVFGVVFFAWRVDLRRERNRAGAFVAYSLVLGTCMMWLGPTQAQIDRTFDGWWSPETVAEVAAHLEETTRPGEEVISGAMIWEFESRRRPFMLISHPLSIRIGVSADRQRQIEDRLRADPPRIIILDGLTEQIYGRNVPIFYEVLGTRYHLERVVTGSRDPVRIFQLEESGAADAQ